MGAGQRTGEITDQELEAAAKMYLSPAFKFDEATFEDLKSETEHMNAVLQGLQVLHMVRTALSLVSSFSGP